MRFGLCLRIMVREMRKELDEELCRKYPRIFRDRHGDMRTTAMCWGFDCGDGWYNIIDILCEAIDSHVRQQREQRCAALLMNRALSRAIRGDRSTLNRLPKWRRDEVLDNLADPEPQCFPVPRKMNVVATQVKEKYGTLRFYHYGGDEYIDGVVAMAESMSARTCETCGAPGELRGLGWVYTACDEHTKPEDKEDEG